MLSLWLSVIFFSTVYSKAIITKYDRIRAMPKVELHVHLDGSIRLETMLDMAKQKNMSLYGATTVEELKKHIVTSTPTTLAKMLEPFDHFLPLFKDDLVALERIAYEQCEDQAAKGVVYFETRYSPHLFCTDGGKVTSRQVVEAISKGLARGEKDFEVVARQIVCCIRGLEKYAEDVLAIATEYRNRGVVGIDTAGASYGADENYGPEIVSVFQRAAELGIPTTAHAGEAGFAKQVENVIENMKVHRVGHGYRIIQDGAIYDKYAVSNKTIHFEACPTSSVMTSSMPMDWDKHAITRWVKDDVNFSLNTDDPTCFDTDMVKEMQLANKKIKMSLTQLWQTFSTICSKTILTDHDRIRAMPKVELHAHLEGSIRPETMLEIAKQKNIDLYGATTVDELKKHIVTSTPTTLAKMLEPFDHFLPLFKDDLIALERIAYEQCQDQAAKGVVYFETRYSPNLLCTDDGNVTSRQVVKAISKGLTRGEKDFGVMARQIVCCVRGLEKYAEDVLAIATEFRNHGVVGIDTAGASYGADEQYGPEIVSVFQRAYELGIPTTAHAGEAGFAKQVKKVIETMKVHRVGHGYRIIQDEAIYAEHAVLNKTIHFEACPTSSVMTSSMPMDWNKHAITRWVKDEVNFSLNTDDPTLFDTDMVNEMMFAHEKFKMSLTQLWQTQLNAAKASFLSAGLKQKLIDFIKNSKPVHYS